MRKKRSVPRNRQGLCSCQPTPRPDRNASLIFGSSLNIEAKTSKPPAMKAGLVSSAKTMDCSTVMAYVPISGRYWTYPAAAWAASHFRGITLRCTGPRGSASAGVSGAPLGEGLVQAQFVADQYHRAGRNGAHVVEHLAYEFVELR